MKKVIILILVTFTSLASFSQNEKIENFKTDAHFQIPGTKYALIAPGENYQNSKKGTGIYNVANETGISITEMPIPYTELVQMFTKDLPPTNGELLIHKKITMNGFNATLFKSNTTEETITDGFDKIDATDKTITWFLLYGNKEFSLIVASTYKYTQDKLMSDKMEQSLLSFLYLEKEEVNPLDQLSFNLDTTKTDLKFATIFMQTGVAYTLDGKFPTEVAQKKGFLIMVMPYDVEQTEQKNSAIKKVKKASDTETEIVEVNALVINNLNAYEVIGYKNKDGNKKLKYSTTIFDKNVHYVIIGTSDHNVEKSLKEFKHITKSFNLKK